MTDDLIDLEPRETEDGVEAEYELTANGSHTLEHWVFLEDLEPGEIP